ncbi:hypothetical protein IQ07DRAFT_375858 [Pyrenochaeta sp. DS3sAY3a]|nr:hypothetical protein IQ07DRAFT_375858 [Pyrenochaeta sp. DS3sAY3a]
MPMLLKRFHCRQRIRQSISTSVVLNRRQKPSCHQHEPIHLEACTYSRSDQSLSPIFARDDLQSSGSSSSFLPGSFVKLTFPYANVSKAPSKPKLRTTATHIFLRNLNKNMSFIGLQIPRSIPPILRKPAEMSRRSHPRSVWSSRTRKPRAISPCQLVVY